MEDSVFASWTVRTKCQINVDSGLSSAETNVESYNSRKSVPSSVNTNDNVPVSGDLKSGIPAAVLTPVRYTRARSAAK